MADQNPPELQGRLDNFQNRNAKKPTSRIGVGALAAGLGLGGAALAYVFASSLQDAADPLQTSDVETFQDQRTGNGGRLEFPADEEDQRVEDALIAVEEALEPQVAEPVPAPAPDETVLRELAALREALAASQSARNSEIQAAVSDLREAFDAQTDALEASIAEKDEELAATARENAARLSGLQAMLDAERAQRESLESELTQSSLIADQRLLEERRRLEEEDRARAAAPAPRDPPRRPRTRPSGRAGGRRRQIESDRAQGGGGHVTKAQTTTVPDRLGAPAEATRGRRGGTRPSRPSAQQRRPHRSAPRGTRRTTRRGERSPPTPASLARRRRRDTAACRPS